MTYGSRALGTRLRATFRSSGGHFPDSKPKAIPIRLSTSMSSWISNMLSKLNKYSNLYTERQEGLWKETWVGVLYEYKVGQPMHTSFGQQRKCGYCKIFHLTSFKNTGPHSSLGASNRRRKLRRETQSHTCHWRCCSRWQFSCWCWRWWRGGGWWNWLGEVCLPVALPACFAGPGSWKLFAAGGKKMGRGRKEINGKKKVWATASVETAQWKHCSASVLWNLSLCKNFKRHNSARLFVVQNTFSFLYEHHQKFQTWSANTTNWQKPKLYW